MKLLEGVYSAIFSVYDENLNVKRDTVNKLVEYQLEGGLKGFYVGGNTGECTVLPKKTRMQMLEAVVDANAGRGQIIAHVGAGHFDEVMDLLEHANSLPIDAIASLPPSLQAYYKPNEIIEYYKILAKKSKKPVYAYVTPVLTCDVVEFAKTIAKIDNIIGLKISIPNYYMFGRVSQINDGNLNILNGPDETMVCGLISGADGAIGTSYNICPKLAVSIYEAFKKGDFVKARELQNKLNNTVITPLINGGSNLAGWKGVMSCMGFDMGHNVTPSRCLEKEDLKRLKDYLDRSNFFDLI